MEIKDVRMFSFDYPVRPFPTRSVVRYGWNVIGTRVTSDLSVAQNTCSPKVRDSLLLFLSVKFVSLDFNYIFEVSPLYLPVLIP